MALTIYDMIAKVSWETNPHEVRELTKLTAAQDKMVDELTASNKKLEQQIIKTNDTAKLKKYNDQLTENKKRIDSITTSQKKQGDMIDQLKTKQRNFIEELKKGGDPQHVQGILRNLRAVENQLRIVDRQVVSMPAKFGNIGSQLLTGITGGIVGGGIVGTLTALGMGMSTFFGNALDEAADAEAGLLRFKQTLDNLKMGKYFDELVEDADRWAAKSKNLFDNDDILAGQAKLIEGTRITKDELKSLIPVAIDLAAKLGVNVVDASTLLTNAIIGKASPELKQLGLNMKGVGTQTLRVAEITGDFAKLLSGSVDVALETTAGRTKQLNQELANLEEQLGTKLLPLQRKWMQFKLGIVEGLSTIFETEDDKVSTRSEKLAQGMLVRLNQFGGKLTEQQVQKKIDLESKYVSKIKEALQINQDIVDSHKSAAASIDANNRNERLRNTLIERQSTLLAYQYFQQQKFANSKDGKIIFNPNAGADDPIEKEKKDKHVAKVKIKTQKELAEEFRKLTEQEFSDNLKLREQYNEHELYLIELLNSTGALTEEHYQDLLLERKVKFFAEQIVFYEDYGKETYNIKLEQLKAEEALIERYRLRARTKALAEKPVTGEFVPGTRGDISVPDGFTSAFATDPEITAARAKEAEINKIKRDGIKERNRMAREELFSNIQMLASEISGMLSQEISRTDKLISLQEERLENAKKSSTASVKIEEDRLTQLTIRRQKYERDQRIIDAAVIVANQAVAVSAAIVGIANAVKEGNALLVAANVVAVLAGLAAGYAAVRSINADTFYEGGYTGDGDARQESTAIGRRPYTYHKKEYVMNERLTSKHKDMFDGLHKGDLIVQKIGSAYYLKPALDTNAIVSDSETVRNSGRTNGDDFMAMVTELRETKEFLKNLKLTVTNTFDAGGFGTHVASQLNSKILLNKLAAGG